MSRTTLSDGSCMSIHFARAIYIMPHPQWLCTCCPAAAVQGVTRTFISTEKHYTYVATLSSISSSKRLQWQNIIYGRSNFRNGHAKCSLVAMAICPIKLPDLYCALHVYLVPLLEQFSGRCETRWPCLCTQTYLAADWCHFRGQTCRSSKHMWNIANAHDLVCFESPPYHRTEQLKSLMQQKSGPIYCWYSVGAATQVDSQRLAHRSVLLHCLVGPTVDCCIFQVTLKFDFDLCHIPTALSGLVWCYMLVMHTNLSCSCMTLLQRTRPLF